MFTLYCLPCHISLLTSGVVRVENINAPEDHIPEVLNRVKSEYLIKTYNISTWTDHEDFLEQVAKRYGKLLKVRIHCSTTLAAIRNR